MEIGKVEHTLTVMLGITMYWSYQFIFFSSLLSEQYDCDSGRGKTKKQFGPGHTLYSQISSFINEDLSFLGAQ